MKKSKPDPHYVTHEKEADPPEHAPKIRKLLEGIESGKLEVVVLAENDPGDGSRLMAISYRRTS